MKQIIPFSKDITFKTKIGELTGISLEHDLTLKGEDLISGNFYIRGTYKMLRTSELEEEYSYKIPCEIAISDEYETFDAILDIDDFNYEIINDEILRVNISLVVDNLDKKEVIEEIFDARGEAEDEEEPELLEEESDLTFTEFPKLSFDAEARDAHDPLAMLKETKPDLPIFEDGEETYSTYCVYIVTEDDTLDKVIDKYHITGSELADYNELDSFAPGMKLIIPSIKND